MSSIEAKVRIYKTDASDYIEFDWAKLTPEYSMPGERIKDRYGLVHRVVPTAANLRKRYINYITLELLAGDMDKVTGTVGTRFDAWIKAHCIDLDTQFYIFAERNGTNSAGTDYTIKNSYSVRLEDIPPWPFGQQWAEGIEDYVPFRFHVAQEGTYTTFSNVATISLVARP